MAGLPPIKRISREDVREAPAWVAKLLDPLNNFMDSVWTSLNRGLTFQDNIASQLYSFRVIAGATASANTTKFTLTMKTRPSGILVVSAKLVSGNYSPIGAAVYAEFTLSEKQVTVTAISGLTNGSTYDITVLLI